MNAKNINTSKLTIEDDIFDINLTFYNFLKKITQARFSDTHANQILTIYYSNSNLETELLKELLYAYSEDFIKRNDLSSILNLISEINQNNIEIFIFALKLNLVKDLLLQEAKVAQSIKSQKLEGLNQLSLAYDKVSIQVAYATRISGALLSLLFFQKLEQADHHFIASSTQEWLAGLIQSYASLAKKGLEPNQIFMLFFAESINQSITSLAGVSYESRIKNVLIGLGIPAHDIHKTHDKNDTSTEFDFFFTHKGLTYGIGAKRTLRECYKQFIKTAHMSQLDVMIEITLGTDLTENTANAIQKHGVYLFVADEVYQAKKYLQEIKTIFPASALNKALLETL